MSLRQPRDGRPTGVKGVISAQAMKDALGLKEKPVEVPVADSPAQARLRGEGRDKEADALASEDYSAGLLSPSETYEAWGSPQLAPPPGSPDGTPVPLPPPKSEAARQARHRPEGFAMNGPSPEESAAEVARDAADIRREQAAELVSDFKIHARKQITAAVEAEQRGDSATAVERATQTLTLGERIVKKLRGG